MIKMHRRISGAVTVLTMTALILTGCTSEASSISSAKESTNGEGMVDTGFTLSTVGSYDSADTAVVLSTDETNKAVTFINMETGKQYTLYYDGTTYVKDKYDGPMTISQIKAGDVVDVTFLKGKKQLASIKLSSEAWVYDDVYNYDLAGANRTATIGAQTYSLPEGAVVLSEGRRVDKAEVVSQDVVTISGIEHKIYSVSVDKGHGYLRLKNDQPLLGGWIEVGNSVIRQITEDMLLVVPEGTYQVTLTNNNISCVKNIVVERNKEVVLDVSDVEIAEDATGKILFSVTPETAKVSVDGEPVDISKVVELSYGIHRVEATASGYDTLTKHIQVGSEYATISFTLEETRQDNDRDSVSGNSVTRDPWEDTYTPADIDSISGNSLSSVSENALGTSNNNKVYVDSPKGVEVYLDGNYVGLSPVRFTKTAGRHEITLRKDGYESKTYTVYLENDKKDETFSFSELVKITGGNGPTSNGTANIPSRIVSAVSEITDCKLINDEDVLIADTTSLMATLSESGVKKVEEAVKNAVVVKAGEAEAANYTFKIAENLTNVTPPKDAEGDQSAENGTGTVSVTIYRKGFTEQTVSCGVVIEKKAEEEPPVLEGNVSVKVTADKVEVEPGGTVTFTAEVKSNEEPIENADVEWEMMGNSNENTRLDGNVLSISEEEPEGKITVTATYTDADSEFSVSDSITVAIKGKKSGLVIGENEDGNVDIPETKEPNKSGLTIGENEDGDVDIPEVDAENESKDADNLNAETFSVTQESHPIRDFFSSLFKK